MDILHLITSFQLGGAEKVAIDLAVKFKKRGHRCIVVAVIQNNSEFGTTIKKMLAEQGIEYYEINAGNYITSILFAPWGLLRLVNKLRPHIVHSHTEFPDFILSLSLRLNNLFGHRYIAVVRTIHNTVLWPLSRTIAHFTEKVFNDDGIIFISRGAARAYNELRRSLNLKESQNSALIYNGIDISAFDNVWYNNQLKDIDLNLDKRKVNFCFAGRLIRQKGFDILIQAVKKLPGEYREKISIHVFGEGYLRSLKRLIILYKLPIVINRPVNYIHNYICCYDYVIMPSRFEGLGMVAIESLGAGVPVLASNAEGLIEVLPLDWPLIVESESVDGLSAMIKDIVDGLYDREALGRLGKKYVEGKFDLNRSVCQYEKFYNRFLKSLPELAGA